MKKPIMAFLAFFPPLATLLVVATGFTHDEVPNWAVSMWVWTLLATVIGMVVFLYDAVVRERVPKEKRSAWLLAFVFLTLVALPTYYVRFIARQPSP